MNIARKLTVLVLVLGLSSLALARDKRNKVAEKAIAKEFCGGGKTSIFMANETGFYLHCKQDDGSFSAVHSSGVLYTIYANRPKPALAQKMEVINPSDERWQKYWKGYQSWERAMREAAFRSTASMRRIPGQ